MLFIPLTSLIGKAESCVIFLSYILSSVCLLLGTWYLPDSWVFTFLFQIVKLVYSIRVFKTQTDKKVCTASKLKKFRTMMANFSFWFGSILCVHIDSRYYYYYFINLSSALCYTVKDRDQVFHHCETLVSSVLDTFIQVFMNERMKNNKIETILPKMFTFQKEVQTLTNWNEYRN